MKILMVCLGNICRSPLAEGILRKKITDRKLNSAVESAGTSNYHEADDADIRSLEVARKHNVDLSRHRGRQFVTTDFDRFDKIFAMDRANYRNIINKARIGDDNGKLFIGNIPGRVMKIRDDGIEVRCGSGSIFIKEWKEVETGTVQIPSRVVSSIKVSLS